MPQYLATDYLAQATAHRSLVLSRMLLLEPKQSQEDHAVANAAYLQPWLKLCPFNDDSAEPKESIRMYLSELSLIRPISDVEVFKCPEINHFGGSVEYIPSSNPSSEGSLDDEVLGSIPLEDPTQEVFTKVCLKTRTEHSDHDIDQMGVEDVIGLDYLKVFQRNMPQLSKMVSRLKFRSVKDPFVMHNGEDFSEERLLRNDHCHPLEEGEKRDHINSPEVEEFAPLQLHREIVLEEEISFKHEYTPVSKHSFNLSGAGLLSVLQVSHEDVGEDVKKAASEDLHQLCADIHDHPSTKVTSQLEMLDLPSSRDQNKLTDILEAGEKDESVCFFTDGKLESPVVIKEATCKIPREPWRDLQEIPLSQPTDVELTLPHHTTDLEKKVFDADRLMTSPERLRLREPECTEELVPPRKVLCDEVIELMEVEEEDMGGQDMDLALSAIAASAKRAATHISKHTHLPTPAHLTCTLPDESEKFDVKYVKKDRPRTGHGGDNSKQCVTEREQDNPGSRIGNCNDASGSLDGPQCFGEGAQRNGASHSFGGMCGNGRGPPSSDQRQTLPTKDSSHEGAPKHSLDDLLDNFIRTRIKKQPSGPPKTPDLRHSEGNTLNKTSSEDHQCETGNDRVDVRSLEPMTPVTPSTPSMKSKRGGKVKIMRIALTDTYKRLIAVFLQIGNPVIHQLVKQKSVEDIPRLSTLTPSVTHFYIKQHQMKLAETKTEDTYSGPLGGLITLHVLVTTLYHLLNISIAAATKCLQRFIEKHPPIQGRFQELAKILDSSICRDVSENPRHEQMAGYLNKWIHCKRLRSPEHDLHMLIIMKHPLQLYDEMTSETVRNLDGFLPVIYPVGHPASYSDVTNSLEEGNCLLVLERQISDDFPWSQFSMVVEYEASQDDTSWRELCERQHIRYLALCLKPWKEEHIEPFIGAPIIEEDTSEQDHISEKSAPDCGSLEKSVTPTKQEHVLIASRDVIDNSKLIHLLESRYDISMIGREYGPSCLTYADILFDERTGMVLHSIAHLSDPGKVELLEKRVFRLALQLQTCWILCYHSENDTLGRTDYVYSGSCPRNIAHLQSKLAQLMSNIPGTTFKVIFSTNVSETASAISKFAEKGSSSEQRDWIMVESSKHEKFLTSFPCLNSFSAQMLLRSGDLKSILSCSKAQLMKCPYLPPRILESFYNMKVSEKATVAGSEDGEAGYGHQIMRPKQGRYDEETHNPGPGGDNNCTNTVEVMPVKDTKQAETVEVVSLCSEEVRTDTCSGNGDERQDEEDEDMVVPDIGPSDDGGSSQMNEYEKAIIENRAYLDHGHQDQSEMYLIRTEMSPSNSKKSVQYSGSSLDQSSEKARHLFPQCSPPPPVSNKPIQMFDRSRQAAAESERNQYRSTFRVPFDHSSPVYHELSVIDELGRGNKSKMSGECDLEHPLEAVDVRFSGKPAIGSTYARYPSFSEASRVNVQTAFGNRSTCREMLKAERQLRMPEDFDSLYSDHNSRVHNGGSRTDTVNSDDYLKYVQTRNPGRYGDHDSEATLQQQELAGCGAKIDVARESFRIRAVGRQYPSSIGENKNQQTIFAAHSKGNLCGASPSIYSRPINNEEEFFCERHVNRNQRFPDIQKHWQPTDPANSRMQSSPCNEESQLLHFRKEFLPRTPVLPRHHISVGLAQPLPRSSSTSHLAGDSPPMDLSPDGGVWYACGNKSPSPSHMDWNPVNAFYGDAQRLPEYLREASSHNLFMHKSHHLWDPNKTGVHMSSEPAKKRKLSYVKIPGIKGGQTRLSFT